ncbi:MAG: DNA-directed RNA polymerase subunit omega [Lachnospiraceae bacterium]
MLYPSCTDLINIVNNDVEPGEQPVVQSRYSIVLAAAKRARQIISGDDPMVPGTGKKPLSMAIEEINECKVKIVSEDDSKEEEIQIP